MLASKFHLNTLKEAPSDAEVISHQLMTRAGMIRKLAGGIYSYMPLGLRSIQKVQNIVRQEMNAAGALEILMPMVQPAELWQESERWQNYGAELLRIKDRHDRDFVLQPTSEEVVTDIARNEIKSWKQLPLNFYHIQTKFRDERRPRFGLMRSREFIMKDAYSFDVNEEAALKSYDIMFKTYCNIFNKLQLNFRPVVADTGSIGGSRSHEFQVIADTGEDFIVYNPDTEFAANIELAPAPCLIEQRLPAQEEMQQVLTPECKTCEEVSTFLKRPLSDCVKTVAMMVLNEKEEAVQMALILIRADHEINEVKLSKLELFKHGYRLAHESEIQLYLKTEPGYMGPVHVTGNVVIIADLTVDKMSHFIVGANQSSYHFVNVNWERDLPNANIVADIRNAVHGDPDPHGKGHLAIQKGIEVGHVFFLGDKYSKMLNASFLNEDGKPQIIQMGCYGIGISRIVAAAIEQNHDEQGIIWPMAIAPFEVVICPLNYHKNTEIKKMADELYEFLRVHNIDVILDDRPIRPGVMFSDWELIGVPLRITLGERAIKEGHVEVNIRKDHQKLNVPIETHQQDILEHYKTLCQS